MEADVTTVVRGDTACISALHVLKVYAQRLGCDLRSSRLVSRVMASSFLVVSCMLWCGSWSACLHAIESSPCSMLLQNVHMHLAFGVPYSRQCIRTLCITSVGASCLAGHRCAGGRHLPAVAALAHGSGGAHRRPPPPGLAPFHF